MMNWTLRSVSHDLRAPLRRSAVQRDADGRLRGRPRRGRPGYAERIQSASDHMAQLIDDLLNLPASRGRVATPTLDLGAEVSQIVADLRRAEPDRNVQFIIQRPVQAQADRALIRTFCKHLGEATPGSSPPPGMMR